MGMGRKIQGQESCSLPAGLHESTRPAWPRILVLLRAQEDAFPL